MLPASAVGASMRVGVPSLSYPQTVCRNTRRAASVLAGVQRVDGLALRVDVVSLSEHRVTWSVSYGGVYDDASRTWSEGREHTRLGVCAWGSVGSAVWEGVSSFLFVECVAGPSLRVGVS